MSKVGFERQSKKKNSPHFLDLASSELNCNQVNLISYKTSRQFTRRWWCTYFMHHQTLKPCFKTIVRLNREQLGLPSRICTLATLGCKNGNWKPSNLRSHPTLLFLRDRRQSCWKFGKFDCYVKGLQTATRVRQHTSIPTNKHELLIHPPSQILHSIHYISQVNLLPSQKPLFLMLPLLPFPKDPYPCL